MLLFATLLMARWSTSPSSASSLTPRPENSHFCWELPLAWTPTATTVGATTMWSSATHAVAQFACSLFVLKRTLAKTTCSSLANTSAAQLNAIPMNETITNICGSGFFWVKGNIIWSEVIGTGAALKQLFGGTGHPCPGHCKKRTRTKSAATSIKVA